MGYKLPHAVNWKNNLADLHLFPGIAVYLTSVQLTGEGANPVSCMQMHDRCHHHSCPSNQHYLEFPGGSKGQNVIFLIAQAWRHSLSRFQRRGTMQTPLSLRQQRLQKRPLEGQPLPQCRLLTAPEEPGKSLQTHPRLLLTGATRFFLLSPVSCLPGSPKAKYRLHWKFTWIVPAPAEKGSSARPEVSQSLSLSLSARLYEEGATQIPRKRGSGAKALRKATLPSPRPPVVKSLGNKEARRPGVCPE